MPDTSPQSKGTNLVRAGRPAAVLKSKANDVSLRLESRPSPVLPLVLAGTLSAITLTAAIAAAVVQIDQVVAVPGRLVTRRNTQALTTPERGVVLQVLVKEGQRVARGQALVVLDPRVQRSEVKELAAQLQAEDARQASERARIRESIVALERQLAIDRQILAPLRRLASQGAAPAMLVAEKERLQVATERELAEARRSEQSLLHGSERTQAQLRAALVDARSKLDLVTLRAPVAGSVLDLQAQTGQVATGATPLLKLVPNDELQAEVFAPNRDLAFIRAGQSAEIGLSAYEPTLYGYLPAIVHSVSQDALPANQDYNFPHFPITLKLNRQYLETRGQKFTLQPGMAVNAQIKLQKRTIFSLIFSRFHQSLDAVRTMR